MPIDDDVQQYFEETKPSLSEIIRAAAERHSTKPHAARDLPQICTVASGSSWLPTLSRETNLTPADVEAFLADYDNDPDNAYARLYVTDKDVTLYVFKTMIQGVARFGFDQSPHEIMEAWIDKYGPQDGPAAFRRTLKSIVDDAFGSSLQQQDDDSFWSGWKTNLESLSAELAMNDMFNGLEPDPTDPHYALWKEYRRSVADDIESMIDGQCCEQLVCEVDEDSTLHNKCVHNRYEAKIAAHRKDNKELEDRLLLAEKTMRAQQKSTAAMRLMAGHRAPARTRRAHAGHGATAKSGDDGDGDGGDGETPRPRTANSPTPPLHHNLTTHPLIAGGAQ